MWSDDHLSPAGGGEQAPSDVAEGSIDAIGKQWTSGLETVKGVKRGCETADSPLGWITLFSTEGAQLYFM